MNRLEMLNFDFTYNFLNKSEIYQNN